MIPNKLGSKNVTVVNILKKIVLNYLLLIIHQKIRKFASQKLKKKYKINYSFIFFF